MGAGGGSSWVETESEATGAGAWTGGIAACVDVQEYTMMAAMTDASRGGLWFRQVRDRSATIALTPHSRGRAFDRNGSAARRSGEHSTCHHPPRLR